MILLSVLCVVLCLKFGFATPQESILKELGLQDEDSKCPGPNEYYSCGGACDNICDTLHIMNQTHCPIVNIMCNKMCYCNDGYARDADNICVLFKECQPSPVRQDRKRRDTSSTTEEHRHCA